MHLGDESAMAGIYPYQIYCIRQSKTYPHEILILHSSLGIAPSRAVEILYYDSTALDLR